MTALRACWRASARLVCAALILGAASLSAAPAAEHRLSLDLLDPVSGSTVKLEPGARALHLVFFATWCPPCLDELDRLAELDARWGERGYRLVLIAVSTRHTPERLARFAGERPLPGTLLFDADGKAQAALGAEDLPTHILLDASGRELLRAPALSDAFVDRLEALIRERERRR